MSSTWLACNHCCRWISQIYSHWGLEAAGEIEKKKRSPLSQKTPILDNNLLGQCSIYTENGIKQHLGWRNQLRLPLLPPFKWLMEMWSVCGDLLPHHHFLLLQSGTSCPDPTAGSRAHGFVLCLASTREFFCPWYRSKQSPHSHTVQSTCTDHRLLIMSESRKNSKLWSILWSCWKSWLLPPSMLVLPSRLGATHTNLVKQGHVSKRWAIS